MGNLPSQIGILRVHVVSVVIILKETKSATMNIFRFFLIFFLNHL